MWQRYYRYIFTQSKPKKNGSLLNLAGNTYWNNEKTYIWLRFPINNCKNYSMKKYSLLLVTFFVMITTITKAQYVNIPDSNFRKYLIQTFPSCFNGAGQMDTTCSGVLNAGTIYCSHGNISDLTGLEYFKNIQILDCSYNNLISLPKLPNNLLVLECNNNQLTTISKLPNNLLKLMCGYNKLTSLPILLNTIKYLDFCNNNILSFNNFPSTLSFFNGSVNYLTSLPNIPVTLETLWVEHNNIDSLPSLPNTLLLLGIDFNTNIKIPTHLPDSLRKIYLGGCYITKLPPIPSKLTTLSVEINNLTSIPTLPKTLTDLRCNGNLLTSLPILPDSLLYFDCGGNPSNLTPLPKLPSTLQLLKCYSDNLSYLPQLPDNLFTLICDGNNINCLPRLPQNLYQLTIDTNKIKCLPNKINGNVYNYVGYNPVTLPICNPTNNVNACQSFPTISGNVFYDQNNNGIKDANEYNDAYAMVFLSNGEYAFTDTNGNYQLSADTLGTYSEVVLTPPYIVPNPGIQSFTFNRYDTGVTAINTGLYATSTFDSLSVAITPLTLAGRPGGSFSYHVSFANQGTTVLNPNIVFNYDNSLLTYTNSNMPLAANTGNSITLNYGSLAPLRKVDFIINFTVKTTAQMGNIVKANVGVTGGSAIATDTVSNLLVSSFDPNDKQATPTLTPTQVVKGDRIRYTVRFQNTGTASAINVVVADTLSSLLQVKTMDIINTSHSCKITMKNNIVYFEFLNINLPDSFHNKDGSHGFITFSIKPLSTLSLGNSIPNTASIYFDYNKAVVTNTAKTIIANTVLPVNIAAFTATLINKEEVYLNWYTSTEVNTIAYNIQRSSNGKEFETIGTQKAKGRGSYHYSDIPAVGVSILYYRLEIVDKDGSKSYSEIRQLIMENGQLIISPNPAIDFVTICGENIKQVTLVDLTGRSVIKKEVNSYSINLAISNLSKGMYMLKAILADGSVKTEQLAIK